MYLMCQGRHCMRETDFWSGQRLALALQGPYALRPSEVGDATAGADAGTCEGDYARRLSYLKSAQRHKLESLRNTQVFATRLRWSLLHKLIVRCIGAQSGLADCLAQYSILCQAVHCLTHCASWRTLASSASAEDSTSSGSPSRPPRSSLKLSLSAYPTLISSRSLARRENAYRRRLMRDQWALSPGRFEAPCVTKVECD